MSHTNITPNYELPQFIDTDNPTWLTDVNKAFETIDETMKTNANNIVKVEKTVPDVSKINDEIATLKASDTLLQQQVTTVSQNVALQDAKISQALSNSQTALTTATGLDDKLERDFKNVPVPQSSWTSDTTYESVGYGQKCEITLQGISTDDTVTVIPDNVLHDTMYYIVNTGSNMLTIWSSKAPSINCNLLLVSARKVSA